MADSKETVYQVDLESLVEKYVWNRYTEDNGFFKNLFHRRSKYYMDIRWGYVEFKHKTTTTERPSDGESDKQNIELYFSEYENKTSDEQSYTFSTSRQTTATTRIELQENYTIGAETNLEVDLGGVVKFGGGVNGALSVTDTKGQEYSETLSWNIETDVNVPSWNKAKASLYVYEKPSISDFEVKTTMSLPSGKLPVSIRRVADDKIVKTYRIMNLKKLFAKDPQISSLVEFKERTNEQFKDIDVVLTTHGVCRNVSWKNQSVKVECELLEGAPANINKAVTGSSKDGSADPKDNRDGGEESS